MGAAKKSRARQPKGRHRKARRYPEARLQWLGAGAVAVGLGAAMATGQGVAVADPGSDADGSSSASASDAAGPASSVDATESDSPGPDMASKPDAPTSTVSASTVTGSSAATDTVDAETPAPDSEESAADLETDFTPTPSAESGESSEPDVVSPPHAVRPVAGSDAGSDASSADTAPAAVDAPTSTTTAKQVVGDGVRTDPDFDAQSSPPVVPARWSPVAIAAAPVTEPVRVRAALTEPVTLNSIVTDVLTWLGLSALASNVPAPPVPVPPPLESLWLMVRRFQYTWNNQAPTARPTVVAQNKYSGLTTGRLDAADFDDDRLTYTVTQEPRHGTVVLNSDGTFTYKPSTDFADAGGVDTFTVSIDDTVGNPWHLHGLAGLLGFKSSVVTVAITVAPVDQTPKILVRQAHEELAQAQTKAEEADGLDAFADAKKVSAKQKRDAAAAILANNPDPQMRADAAELIRQAEDDERDAADYATQEAVARLASQDLQDRAIARIDEARSLDPDVDIGNLPGA